MKRLISILICSLPASASPPFIPVATCEGQVCTMTKADYEEFQQFHAQTIRRAIEMERHMQQLEGLVGSLESQLTKNLHCQVRKI